MSELAFVISADRGVMQDERTGRMNAWMNVHYLTDYRETGEDSVGFKPIKITCTPEVFETIHRSGIGLYKLDFKTRPGAMGKPTLTLVKSECVVGKIDPFELGQYRPQTRPAQGAAPQQSQPAPQTKVAA